jgi:hypothetical protein
MTEDQVKEQLSNRYVGVLATNSKFMLDKGDLDFGVDYTAKKTFTYTHPGTGKPRLTIDSRTIDLQLKATTESSIIDGPTDIKYDLEVKNYNDLVFRLTNSFTPLLLILFVLPDKTSDWVEVTPTELRVRRHAYWYQPSPGTTMTHNLATARITIPKTNVLDINCFDTLHTQFYP